MILNRKHALFAVRAALIALLLVVSGCASWNEKIASRKGYVRFPGKQYAAGEKAEIGTKIEGDASYYGPGFDGKQTASGEIFDQDDYTCAHKTLPFGTKLKVVRKDNGESVEVRVNDRGPYVGDRILDDCMEDLGMEDMCHDARELLYFRREIEKVANEVGEGDRLWLVSSY
jgi:rare lipoprotein A